MKALITGITGQDGSYLAELLLDQGYEVNGTIRRASTPNTSRIDHIVDRIRLHYADMTCGTSIETVVAAVKPDEVYNLAAMSQVRISYDMPANTADITATGYARLLEAVRKHCPEARVYQASSSEMFGKVQETPQTERTPFYPRSPYGCAKAYSFYLGRSYREGYGLRVSNGILFNHESPRRGDNFVSKKIVQAVARIKRGEQKMLTLGNLEAKRDWGYAKEYAYWIWKIIQHPEPDDFLIATGETHSVEEFVSAAFEVVGLNWLNYVLIDDALKRPAEVDLLQGDASKARDVLGFEPKVKFAGLVELMVKAEIDGHV